MTYIIDGKYVEVREDGITTVLNKSYQTQDIFYIKDIHKKTDLEILKELKERMGVV